MVWEEAMASISAQQMLLVAARNGDRAGTLRLLMEDGVLIDCKDTMGFTPLMWAVYFNHTEVTELLLSYVANLDSKNAGGHTPLHIAASKGHIACVNLLCKAGANITACSKNGYTPLHDACYYGRLKCVLSLLENKAALVDAKSNDGCTSLHVAASRGNVDVCEVLLNFGAYIEATDSLGKTPLHLAASVPNGKSALELLIRKGANPVKKCAKGRTPLQYALDHNCTQNASVLRSAETSRPSFADSEIIEIKGEGDSNDNPNQFVKYSHPTQNVNYPDSVQYKDNTENSSIYGSPRPNNSFVYNSDFDAENLVQARVDELRKEMEGKVEQQNKLIQQLQLEKEKTELRRRQQQHHFSQEISTLHDQLRIVQKQLEIGRTEKASTQLDLEITQKKLELISAELQQQLSKQKSLHDQLTELEESHVCKICFENKVDTVLFPCSHFCLCRTCTLAVVKKNRKCPICRAYIERSMQCYFT